MAITPVMVTLAPNRLVIVSDPAMSMVNGCTVVSPRSSQ